VLALVERLNLSALQGRAADAVRTVQGTFPPHRGAPPAPRSRWRRRHPRGRISGLFGLFGAPISLLYRNWPTGIRVDETGISIGVLASPFMRAALIIEVNPLTFTASQIRPARYYSNFKYGHFSHLIHPQLSPAWGCADAPSRGAQCGPRSHPWRPGFCGRSGGGQIGRRAQGGERAPSQVPWGFRRPR